VRHGETDWNQEEVFRGRIDVKLNTTGVKQAEATGKALKEMAIKVIYTSPLSRARVTAERIAQIKTSPVVEEPGFTDINFGEWQGIPLSEVRERYKGLYHIWKTDPQKMKFSGGESLKEVEDRSIKALEQLMKKHPEETVGIISHRVVCKVIILNVLKLPLSRFWDIRQDTCSINIFEYRDEKWIIELLNDTCHIKSLVKERLSDF